VARPMAPESESRSLSYERRSALSSHVCSYVFNMVFRGLCSKVTCIQICVYRRFVRL
jgi:hypothetical protein